QTQQISSIFPYTTLFRSRSVDGAITYSSNGDGTINIYEVPLHWESPAQVEKGYMQTYTEKIIHNTKLAYIDPGDDDQVINLIEIDRKSTRLNSSHVTISY